VLLCSIVVETHTRFASLSTATAFGALGATCLFMALLGSAARRLSRRWSARSARPWPASR
jgi:hypothetical protein